jgi:hypothetical protein
MATAPLRATLLNTGAPVGFDVDFFPRLYREPSNRSLRLKRLPVGQGSAAGWVIKLEFS